MKKIIINADDFAYDIYHNDAVLDGYKKGLLNSASIMVNMENYKDAIENIVPLCPNLQLGIHLNLIEGKALIKESKYLVNKDGYFKNSFLTILFNSFNSNFLKEVENEFRAQIELAKKDIEIKHIDSHVHIHSIPPIFEIVAKLAEEYKIPYIRLQKEHPYKIRQNFDYKKYFVNMLKVFILNYFTIINKQFLTKYNLITNDYLLGVSYSGMMNKETILEGLRNVRKSDCIVECIMHPSKNIQDKNRYSEFETFFEEDLLERIKNIGFNFYNYDIIEELEEETKEIINKE